MRADASTSIAAAAAVVLSMGVGVAIGRGTAERRAVYRLVVPGTLSPTPQPVLPKATLRVASDGCGVIRNDFPGAEPRGLTWSVKDAEGFEVLARNALGETHYRYYLSGTYTVVLSAWDGDSYAPISNTVTIHC